MKFATEKKLRAFRREAGAALVEYVLLLLLLVFVAFQAAHALGNKTKDCFDKIGDEFAGGGSLTTGTPPTGIAWPPVITDPEAPIAPCKR